MPLLHRPEQSLTTQNDPAQTVNSVKIEKSCISKFYEDEVDMDWGEIYIKEEIYIKVIITSESMGVRV